MSNPPQQNMSIEQALELAVGHHGAGELQQAESLYWRILDAAPEQPVALHLLGAIAHQMGDSAAAVDHIGKAVAVEPSYAEAHGNLGLALQALGRTDDAVASYRRALAINPDFFEVHYNLGNALQELGRFDEAITSYGKAIAINGENAGAHFNLGNALMESGRLDDAVASYDKAIAIRPDHAPAHGNRGLALQELGRLDDAVAGFREALDLNPGIAEAHNNLGNALLELGRLDGAVAGFREALAIQPDFAEAHYNLGNALQEQELLKEAVACFKAAISANPDYAEAYSNMGNALRRLERFEEGIVSCHKALAIKPDFVEARYNLGTLFHELGMLNEAVTSYQKVLAIQPDNADAHNSFGQALHKMGRLDDAVASYRRAMEINPEHPDVNINLGSAFGDKGAIDKAAEQYDLAIAKDPENAGLRIKRALLMPVIPASGEDIEARRKTLAGAVKAVRDQNQVSSEAPGLAGTTNFYLAYHEKNNKRMAKDIAEMHIAAFPGLEYEAKHCASGQTAKKDVLRVGFISTFFHNHTIGKLNLGLVQKLSRDDFEVVVFRPQRKKDDISAAFDTAADKVVTLRKDLEHDLKAIADEELDILFYTDIGMDNYLYYLAYARLAPVQAVTWGHPDTTGIPNMDYFISSETLEPSGEHDHYNEQLIKLNDLAIYFYRPRRPNRRYIRKDYGLPDGVRLYVCPQPLFKFHPDFDRVLGELLRRDSGGRLVLLDDNKGGCWKKLLLERFQSAFPDVADRVEFVPRMELNKFLGLTILADAVLDVPTFSGGNSSIEMFAMGVPIVTLPGNFLRGRITLACYKQMGLSDLVASDEESYISLALRLARDSDFRKRMQADIQANSDKLFETIEPVRELEAFFHAAHDAWRDGRLL